MPHLLPKARDLDISFSLRESTRKDYRQ